MTLPKHPSRYRGVSGASVLESVKEPWKVR